MTDKPPQQDAREHKDLTLPNNPLPLLAQPAIIICGNSGSQRVRIDQAILGDRT